MGQLGHIKSPWWGREKRLIPSNKNTIRFYYEIVRQSRTLESFFFIKLTFFSGLFVSNTILAFRLVSHVRGRSKRIFVGGDGA